MAAFGRRFSQAILALALLLASRAQAQEARIVSTSLCGDSYVWALAPAPDIAALSWQADTKLSAAPPALRHKNRGMAKAERLLALVPSLVVLGPGDPPRAGRFGQKTGAAVFALKWSEGFAGIYDNLRRLGAATGRPERADVLVLNIKARLTALQSTATSVRGRPRVLYLAPGGMSAGSGSFVDAAIRAAGGRNHAAGLGLAGWGRVPLEKLALEPPDLIITSFFDAGYASLADLRSRHPLLQRALQEVPTANIPARYWICAGPLLADAAQAIARALAALPDGAKS